MLNVDVTCYFYLIVTKEIIHVQAPNRMCTYLILRSVGRYLINIRYSGLYLLPCTPHQPPTDK